MAFGRYLEGCGCIWEHGEHLRVFENNLVSIQKLLGAFGGMGGCGVGALGSI